MGPEMTILSIGNAWSARAIELILPIQQLEFHLPVTAAGQPDLADIDRFYHAPGGGFWGAVIDGRLIGTIGLLAIGNHTGVIRKLFVHKDARGPQGGDARGPQGGDAWGPQGGVAKDARGPQRGIAKDARGPQRSIAQRLLDTLIDHARTTGIRDLYLGTVDTMKAAARLYERNGAVRIQKTQLPPLFPLVAVDNTFYHLHIVQPSRRGGSAIDRSGILAIATRLQRLSDQLRKDAAMIYAAAGIRFEAKWFPVIYVLDARSPLTVMEIAADIGYTHPSTISLLQQLEKERLVRSARDRTDSRRRHVQLTPKGRKLVERMRPVWQHMTRALAELTDTPHALLHALDEVEAQLEKENFLERTRRLL